MKIYSEAKICVKLSFFLLPLFFLIPQIHAEESKPDNGTDPTKHSRAVGITGKYTDLGSGNYNNAPYVFFQTPVSQDGRTSVRVEVPYVNTNLGDNSDYGLGDASIKLTNVFKMNKQYGIVFSGKMIFDTADKVEHGTGKNVFEGTMITAFFLKNGAIFAPSVVQSNSVSGAAERASVNTTTVDFYYVPKLANHRLFMTIDPSLNSNWETNAEFVELAVTVGYMLGTAFGGHDQVYTKPFVMGGQERPADWGIEIGYKIIGF